jgi:hypothetical protein
LKVMGVFRCWKLQIWKQTFLVIVLRCKCKISVGGNNFDWLCLWGIKQWVYFLENWYNQP